MCMSSKNKSKFSGKIFPTKLKPALNVFAKCCKLSCRQNSRWLDFNSFMFYMTKSSIQQTETNCLEKKIKL